MTEIDEMDRQLYFEEVAARNAARNRDVMAASGDPCPECGVCDPRWDCLRGAECARTLITIDRLVIDA